MQGSGHNTVAAVGLRRAPRQSSKPVAGAAPADGPVQLSFRTHTNHLSKAPFLFCPKNFNLCIPAPSQATPNSNASHGKGASGSVRTGTSLLNRHASNETSTQASSAGAMLNADGEASTFAEAIIELTPLALLSSLHAAPYGSSTSLGANGGANPNASGSGPSSTGGAFSPTSASFTFASHTQTGSSQHFYANGGGGGGGGGKNGTASSSGDTQAHRLGTANSNSPNTSSSNVAGEFSGHGSRAATQGAGNSASGGGSGSGTTAGAAASFNGSCSTMTAGSVGGSGGGGGGGAGGGGGGGGSASTGGGGNAPTAEDLASYYSIHPSGSWICRAYAFSEKIAVHATGSISVNQHVTNKCAVVNDLAKGKAQARVLHDYATVQRKYGLQYVQLAFAQQFISRSDMFLISESLKDMIVFEGMDIELCGFTLRISEMLIDTDPQTASLGLAGEFGSATTNGVSYGGSAFPTSPGPQSQSRAHPAAPTQRSSSFPPGTGETTVPTTAGDKIPQLRRVKCGLITTQTKVNFVSLSFVNYVLLEISKEMWDPTADGRIAMTWAVKKFLQDLLEQQVKYKASPLTRIVMYGRLEPKYCIRGMVDFFHTIDVPRHSRADIAVEVDLHLQELVKRFECAVQRKMQRRSSRKGAVIAGTSTSAAGKAPSSSEAVSAAGLAAHRDASPTSLPSEMTPPIRSECMLDDDEDEEDVDDLEYGSGAGMPSPVSPLPKSFSACNAARKAPTAEKEFIPCTNPRDYFVHAKHSNTIEAIALILEQSGQHHVDRRLVTTGFSITVISAGKGIYQVTNDAVQVTATRLYDVGVKRISVVCMGRPPLHTTPLLEYACEDESLRSQYHLHVEQRNRRFYEKPEWMQCFFFYPSGDLASSSGGPLGFELLTKEMWLARHPFTRDGKSLYTSGLGLAPQQRPSIVVPAADQFDRRLTTLLSSPTLTHSPLAPTALSPRRSAAQPGTTSSPVSSAPSQPQANSPKAITAGSDSSTTGAGASEAVKITPVVEAESGVFARETTSHSFMTHLSPHLTVSQLQSQHRRHGKALISPVLSSGTHIFSRSSDMRMAAYPLSRLSGVSFHSASSRTSGKAVVLTAGEKDNSPFLKARNAPGGVEPSSLAALRSLKAANFTAVRQLSVKYPRVLSPKEGLRRTGGGGVDRRLWMQVKTPADSSPKVPPGRLARKCSFNDMTLAPESPVMLTQYHVNAEQFVAGQWFCRRSAGESGRLGVAVFGGGAGSVGAHSSGAHRDSQRVDSSKATHDALTPTSALGTAQTQEGGLRPAKAVASASNDASIASLGSSDCALEVLLSEAAVMANLKQYDLACGLNVLDSDLLSGSMALVLDIDEDVMPQTIWNPQLIYKPEMWSLFMSCFAGRDDRLSLDEQEYFMSHFRPTEVFARDRCGLIHDGRTIVLFTVTSYTGATPFNSAEEIVLLFNSQLFAPAASYFVSSPPQSTTYKAQSQPWPRSQPVVIESNQQEPSENARGESRSAYSLSSSDISKDGCRLTSRPNAATKLKIDPTSPPQNGNTEVRFSSGDDVRIHSRTPTPIAGVGDDDDNSRQPREEESTGAPTKASQPNTEEPVSPFSSSTGESLMHCAAKKMTPLTSHNATRDTVLTFQDPSSTDQLGGRRGSTSTSNKDESSQMYDRTSLDVPSSDDMAKTSEQRMVPLSPVKADALGTPPRSVAFSPTEKGVGPNRPLRHKAKGGAAGTTKVLSIREHQQFLSSQIPPHTCTTVGYLQIRSSILFAIHPINPYRNPKNQELLLAAYATSTPTEHVSASLVFQRRWQYAHPDTSSCVWSLLCHCPILPLYGSKSVYSRDSFYMLPSHQYGVRVANPKVLLEHILQRLHQQYQIVVVDKPTSTVVVPSPVSSAAVAAAATSGVSIPGGTSSGNFAAGTGGMLIGSSSNIGTASAHGSNNALHQPMILPGSKGAPGKPGGHDGIFAVSAAEQLRGVGATGGNTPFAPSLLISTAGMNMSLPTAVSTPVGLGGATLASATMPHSQRAIATAQWPRADPAPHSKVEMTIGHQTHDIQIGETVNSYSIVRQLHRGMYSNAQTTHLLSYTYMVWNYLDNQFEPREAHLEAQVGEKYAFRWDVLDGWLQQETMERTFIPRSPGNSLKIREICFAIFPEKPENPVAFSEFYKFIGFRFSLYLVTRGNVSWKEDNSPLTTDIPQSALLYPDPPPLQTARLVHDRQSVSRDRRPIFDPITGKTIAFDAPGRDRVMAVDISLPEAYNPHCHYYLRISWLICTSSIVSDWAGSFVANALKYHLTAVQVPCYYDVTESAIFSVSHSVKVPSRVEPQFRARLLERLTGPAHRYYPDTPRMNRNCRLVHHSGLCYVISPPSSDTVAQWCENRLKPIGTPQHRVLFEDFMKTVDEIKKEMNF